MGNVYSNHFPPKPRWSVDDMPDLAGKVACVTGGYGGIGYEITKALLQHNATVYIAGRSRDRADAAMAKLSLQTGNNNVHFIPLDLTDLDSVIAAAREFISTEQRLDLLFNNAGVMNAPWEPKTKQGYEMHWGTNVLGPFLFTKELLPVLLSTAKRFPEATRVIWVSSIAHIGAPKSIINFDDVSLPKQNGWTRYSQSKAANILLATAMAHQYSDEGLLTFSVHPGTIYSDLGRSSGFVIEWILKNVFMHPTHLGALTPLYPATNPDLTRKDSGRYFMPWARPGTPKKGMQDVELAMKLWAFLEVQIEQGRQVGATA